jgi:hypothetical protein
MFTSYEVNNCILFTFFENDSFFPYFLIFNSNSTLKCSYMLMVGITQIFFLKSAYHMISVCIIWGYEYKYSTVLYYQTKKSKYIISCNIYISIMKDKQWSTKHKRKTKDWATQTPLTIWGCAHVLRNGKQSLHHYWHPSCYMML